MSRSSRFAFVVAALVGPASMFAQKTAAKDWSAVDKALGRAGAMQPGDVYKFSFPRSDLQVTVGGVRVKPALALGSWVAFKRTSDGRAVVMGDLVLSPDEIPAVMSRLQAGGVDQSALHNHTPDASPPVLYMHIMARGDEVAMAKAIHDALATSHTPLDPPAPPSAAPPPIDLDTTAVARALGYTGKTNGGVYQVAVPRPEKIREMGIEVPPSMGVATALNIQPTSGGRAVATGDFVLLPAEVNPVIRALRSHGIAVTALHTHLLTESPHLMFMHFWADDDAVKVAQGLRAGLDATGMKPKGGK